MLFPGREKRECAALHRIFCLKRKIIETGKPMRPRDHSFLKRVLVEFPSKKKDKAMEFHVEMALKYEKLWVTQNCLKTS